VKEDHEGGAGEGAEAGGEDAHGLGGNPELEDPITELRDRKVWRHATKSSLEQDPDRGNGELELTTPKRRHQGERKAINDTMGDGCPKLGLNLRLKSEARSEAKAGELFHGKGC